MSAQRNSSRCSVIGSRLTVIKPFTEHRTSITGRQERGNAFFIILISIALFGALMFTFARGARQGGDNLMDKSAVITASDIVTFAQKMERSVQRVYGRGISENTISFENDHLAGYANAFCGAGNDGCKIFMPEGGGIGYQPPAANVSSGPWIFSGENTILGIGEDARADLIAILPGISANVCTALNESLNIAGIPADGDGIETATLFQGSFNNAEQIGDVSISGLPAACVSESGTNYFYHVLLAR